MLWTDEYLNRIAKEAEAEIAKELQCIIDRLSLTVYEFVSEYQLPDYVMNVRRVFWKGIRLDPVSGVNQIHLPVSVEGVSAGGIFDVLPFDPVVFDVDQRTIAHGLSASKPHSYYYSKFGENVIKFIPSPNENVDAVYDGLYTNNIANAVIVEFYRQPDENLGFVLPKYFRRRTIKAYVMWKSFAKEGPGQNLNASKYWQAKYIILLKRAKFMIDNLYKVQENARYDTISRHVSHEYMKRRGPLPSNYGIPVGDWDL